MSALPAGVRGAVETVLGDRTGRDVSISGTDSVAGGCISPTARIETGAGPFFLKWGGPDLPAGLLAAEARGLRALADAGEVRVPDVVAGSGVADGPDPSASSDAGAADPGPRPAPEWLLLEWLEPGRAGRTARADLGANLAGLHRHRADAFGADADNFIGSLHQANDPADSWPDFWRARRLEPQLRMAIDAGLLDDGDRRRFDDLFDRLDDLLAPAGDDGPSLLHGDLWGGNVHMMADGTAAFIDPSVYHGHREVDLAMAELFGGFGHDFFGAYADAWPLAPGYRPTRRAVYQLYYLLVHVNLFGREYVGRTRQALEAAG